MAGPQHPPSSPRRGGLGLVPPYRPAVVLAADGCAEAALGLVRALGVKGVPVILVAESAHPLAAHSRWVRETHVCPRPFAQDPGALLTLLQGLARNHEGPLPVFPSGDPDLEALRAVQHLLGPALRSSLCEPELVAQLLDKDRFRLLAAAQALPVPASAQPADAQALRHHAAELGFPLVLKPAFPFNWSQTLRETFERHKALIVQSPEELEQWLTHWGGQSQGLLVQRLIPGSDDQHFDVHAHVAENPKNDTAFTGRKWRIYPIHAGSGSFVEAVEQANLESATIAMLRRIGFRGIANVNYKRCARTGEFLLLEINARVSQWSTFTTRMGFNLPWRRYLELVGQSARLVPPLRRQGHWYFIDAKLDLKAYLQHRAESGLGLSDYAGSLLQGRLMAQVLQVRDPLPGLVVLGRLARSFLRRLLVALGASLGTSVSPPGRRGAAGAPSPTASKASGPNAGHPDDTVNRPAATLTPMAAARPLPGTISAGQDMADDAPRMHAPGHGGGLPGAACR